MDATTRNPLPQTAPSETPESRERKGIRALSAAGIAGAAVALLGVGAIPAAQASAAGVATGIHHVTESSSATSIVATTTEASLRFVVNAAGSLTRI